MVNRRDVERNGYLQADIVPEGQRQPSRWSLFLRGLADIGRALAGRQGQLVCDIEAAREAARLGGTEWLRQHAVRNAHLESEIVRNLTNARGEDSLMGVRLELTQAQVERERAETEKLKAEAYAISCDASIRTIAALRAEGFDVQPIIQADGRVVLAISDSDAHQLDIPQHSRIPQSIEKEKSTG